MFVSACSFQFCVKISCFYFRGILLVNISLTLTLWEKKNTVSFLQSREFLVLQFFRYFFLLLFFSYWFLRVLYNGVSLWWCLQERKQNQRVLFCPTLLVRFVCLLAVFGMFCFVLTLVSNKSHSFSWTWHLELFPLFLFLLKYWFIFFFFRKCVSVFFLCLPLFLSGN